MSTVVALLVQARQGVHAGDYGVIPANREYLYVSFGLDPATVGEGLTFRAYISADNGGNWTPLLGSIVGIGPGPYEDGPPRCQIYVSGIAGKLLRVELSIPSEIEIGCEISDEQPE